MTFNEWQKNDPQFSSMLDSVRRGCPTKETVGVLKQRSYRCLSQRFFFQLGHRFVYTSELPLSSRNMSYIIERKIRSMGFSGTVYFLCETWLSNQGCFETEGHTGVSLRDFSFSWGHSFVYTSELPLSSRNMSYIIERKIRSMGFSETVYFLQGTHTNSMDWGSNAVRNRPSSDLTLDRATYAILH